VNLNDHSTKPWPLPEANDNTILIGSLDANGDIYQDPRGTYGSSYGARKFAIHTYFSSCRKCSVLYLTLKFIGVDYWVRGLNLAYEFGELGGLKKVDSTSFGMSIPNATVSGKGNILKLTKL
jgi:hypothetical protein